MIPTKEQAEEAVKEVNEVIRICPNSSANLVILSNLAQAYISGELIKPKEWETKPIDFKFRCGCFLIVYIRESDSQLGAGFSCCPEHEHPYARVEEYYLTKTPLPKYDIRD